METPQEIEVWYLLPAIRRELAISLKKEGMKQKEIAAALDLSEPAVSQYFRSKRGDEISFNDEMARNISSSAKLIAGDNSKMRYELQRLLRKTRDTKFICSVCNSHANTSKECEICYI